MKYTFKLSCLASLAAILALTSCDKIKQQVSPSPQQGDTRTEISLDEPTTAADPRQRQNGLNEQLKSLSSDTGTLQQQVEKLEKKDGETEAVLEAMTKALETVNRKNADLEREMSTLRLKVEAANSGGFNR